MKNLITEDHIEEAALQILKDDLNYDYIYGPDIAPDGKTPQRKTYQDVVLIDSLQNAIQRINPNIPKEAREEAIKKVLRTSSPKQILDNQNFHKLLTEGVPVEYRKNGKIKHDTVWLVNFENPNKNEFLAINQFTIIENNVNKRPDVILFINGLPLVVIELKNIADEKATIADAFNQLQTYKEQISSLFKYNEILVISDGHLAKAGTFTSNKDRFMPWKTINGKEPKKEKLELEILLKGMFEKSTFLELIRHFIVFEKEKEINKKLAAYHQYNAVKSAVVSTIRASAKSQSQIKESPESYGLASVSDQPKGDKKAGIVWHTQGSGKSLSMVFYAGKLALSKELENPTMVVLTDRTDLDDQLFKTFSRCKELLRQKPKKAESRNQIKELLNRSSGGVIFTTIQKFFPEKEKEKYPTLSNRKNIIVIVDEAHRTQYGFGAKVTVKEDKALLRYGYAKYLRDALPNASFIGFTGTPIEKSDKSTPAVFGKYVDVYDIKKAVDDGATVRLLYENRLAKLDIKPEERLKIDPQIESITEDEEAKTKSKSKWARLEAVVGSPNRINKIAKDIIKHFEERNSVFEGKAMIVAMSRRICVDLYNEIIKIKPEWDSSDDKKGEIKVIMTGSSSDPKEWQKHIRNKLKRTDIGERFKDDKDPLKLVIVRDMWLTGFDVPSLHAMYIDKPMKGHGLMQAIARANRKYKDKDAGLIVDYIGIGVDLKKAITDYTEGGGRGKPVVDLNDAVEKMLEKYEVVRDMFHGFNYKKFFELNAKERISIVPQAIDHILKGKDDLKKRFVRETTALLRAFSLSVPDKRAMNIKEEVGFFQAIKSAIIKNTTISGQYKEELDSAIKQILSKSIISDRIVDIFEAAGINKPDISVLSDKFLIEVKGLKQKNLAFEALKKLLNDEIRIIMKKNVVQGKSFMEMLDKTIKRYTNKNIEAAEAIDELIKMAKKFREEREKGKEFGLNETEIAFYDALADCNDAIEVLGDEKLRFLALELVKLIRNSVKIDWTIRESVKADLRLKIKKLLKKYGYPPVGQEHATELVLKQAELVAKDWAEKNN
ncbi:type I restriction endonuclease subunit R [Candidatus Pacearchaeota archaeon]|nr:type I restriction endonuclease subunit R [Candidatus Pacearchaeota archaeon]